MNTTEPKSLQTVLARLNRIEGQVRGIRHMVEEQRPCIDILRQLAATDAALRAAAKVIISEHMDRCFEEAAHDPNRRRALHKELLETFGRFG